jgi:hypothetical protein
MPATEVCMGCHSQIWRDSPLLAPVRESYRTGRPLAWTRVHNVADYVFFNHSIHVAKGIGCESCHGRVDRMPLMRSTATLHMEWCLRCHRHPETFVRAKQDIYRFGLGAARRADDADNGNALSLTTSAGAPHGADLVKEYGIVKKQLTDCAICHR